MHLTYVLGTISVVEYSYQSVNWTNLEKRPNGVIISGFTKLGAVM
jgi:hypothetical protein